MPISSPGSLRSPRSQALSMGTTPGMFLAEAPYDCCAGVPSVMAGGHYQDQSPQIDTNTKSLDTTVPFTITSGR